MEIWGAFTKPQPLHAFQGWDRQALLKSWDLASTKLFATMQRRDLRHCWRSLAFKVLSGCPKKGTRKKGYGPGDPACINETVLLYRWYHSSTFEMGLNSRSQCMWLFSLPQKEIRERQALQSRLADSCEESVSRWCQSHCGLGTEAILLDLVRWHVGLHSWYCISEVMDSGKKERKKKKEQMVYPKYTMTGVGWDSPRNLYRSSVWEHLCDYVA